MAIALLASNSHALVKEAKEVAPQLAEICAPGGDDAVTLICGRLAILFGVPPDRNSQHWEAVAGDYYKALREFPLEALLGAEIDYKHDPDARFFPLPGQLRALAKTRADRLHAAAYRAKMIAAGELKAKSEPDDPATKVKLAQDLKDLAAELAAKSRAPMVAPLANRTLDLSRAPSPMAQRMIEEGMRRSKPMSPAPATPPPPGPGPESDAFS